MKAFVLMYRSWVDFYLQVEERLKEAPEVSEAWIEQPKRKRGSKNQPFANTMIREMIEKKFPGTEALAMFDSVTGKIENFATSKSEGNKDIIHDLLLLGGYAVFEHWAKFDPNQGIEFSEFIFPYVRAFVLAKLDRR